jgi:hypothetical protein
MEVKVVNSRERVLKAIQKTPGITTKELCAEAGVTPVRLWGLADELIPDRWVTRTIVRGLPVRWYPTGKELLQ